MNARLSTAAGRLRFPTRLDDLAERDAVPARGRVLRA